MALGPLLSGLPSPVRGQSFRQAPTFATGEGPRSIAAGDFNLDGKTDLAVANGLSDDVSVLLGDGAGGFAPAVNHPVDGPIALVSEDYNEDGRLDLAVVRSFALSIWLGDGLGGFPTQTEVPIAGYSEFATTADFNDDAHHDVAIGLWDPVASNYAVAILLGDGHGAVSTPVHHEVGNGASSIAVAHLDGDRNLDLAVANLHSNTLSLLFGDGSGGFGPCSTVVVGPIWAGPASVTAGDFNRDGWSDLASANAGSDDVTILTGNGTGGFSPPVTHPAGFAPWVIDAADFNGDSNLDLAVANRANTVSIFTGDGAGGFVRMIADHAVGRNPVSLVVADFNRDGAADVATANADYENDTPHDVSILLGDGMGGFPAAARSHPVGSGPLSLAAGKFNGDAMTDLVAANQSSHDLSVLFGAAGGMFGPTANYGVSGYLQDVAVGDFNGDGYEDLAAAKYFTATVAVLLADGAGGFGPPVEFNAGLGWPTALLAADLNEDGNIDLLVAQWGCLVAVHFGDGKGGFSLDRLFGTGGCESNAVATGDFNKDRHTDVAVAYYGDQVVSILLGNGSGGFASVATYPAGNGGPASVAVGDFNADDAQDLAVANNILAEGAPPSVTILLGNGSGGFGPPVSYPAGEMTASVAVADFNGDGRQDVAAANFGSHEVSILSGDGTGTFLPPLNFIVGFAPSSLVVEDFDADGKTDLAVVHAASPGDVWILLNTTVFQKADLAVAKDDGTTVAVPGSPLSYTITVTNLGPDPVTSLMLKDAVPAALLGPVFTPSTGAYNPETGSWTGFSLAAGQSLTLTLSGTVSPMATGTLVNTATVMTEVGVLDPISANDSATDTDTVAPAANLVLTMTDSPDPVPEGGGLTYALTVSNLGPLAATAVTLIDPLPAAVTFVSASPGCMASGATVTCAVGNLGPGASQVVSIHTTVNRYTMATNTASVSANEVDPAAGNNVASAETQILIGSEGELTHGTVLWRDLAALPGPAAKEDLYRLGRQPRSSYEVVVDSASGDVSGGSGVLLQRVAADLTTVLQDSAPVAVGFGRSLRFENASAVTVVDEAFRVRSAGCTTDCGPDDVYRIRAYETTYAIPRFNNAGGQVTVLLIQNHGDEAVAGNIWFWSPTGTLLASRSLVLETKATLVLDTTSVPGLSGIAGSITVSSDGSYGALGGKAVTLDPSSGFSLDAPMVARTE